MSVCDLSALFWPTDAVFSALGVAVNVRFKLGQAPGSVRVSSQNASQVGFRFLR